jgi:quercetin dioxygenase-like cupin family protein
MNTQSNPAYVKFADQGAVLMQLGHTAIEKVLSTDSSGAYYCFTVSSPPGLGIPPHCHAREDEIIHIIEGDFEVFLGGKLLRVGTGDTLHFPRGTAHGFANVGNTVAKTIWFVSPGTSFEEFFNQLAQTPPGPPDIPKLAALFGQYGMDLLPPPGL